MDLKSLILHQGRSLTLRRTQPSDAPLLLEKMYSRYEFMRLFRLNDRAETVEQVREKLIQRSRSSSAQSSDLECLIIHKTHGAIGIIAAVDYTPLHRKAELLVGIFDPEHRSVSHGVEACLLMTDLVFNAYNLHRFYAHSYGYNHSVHIIFKKVGAELEGIMKEHLYDPVSQEYVDMHIFGMVEAQMRQNSRIARLSKRLIGRDITQPLTAPLPPPDLSKIPECEQLRTAPTWVKSGALIPHPN
ncbi:GNAT family N-acetyltransferase [Roseofilum capinflatum]|uniref:GNAT family protein n=1 Tax=Roseofilum capinflatum BLCC-M114 TaxID=3022440 RepID=A0ABT7B235_9CYAN|nr:GNAT family protein [Roseofilum capinflatum]MDJ1173222.1 GNAT family protein [Roseofilum capinflatum BLCC-M114]